jgi:hypothetical protein|tara:strand:- start:153 stop:761 length:609 start_codon:yes stop_codon:yes gene_type:complete
MRGNIMLTKLQAVNIILDSIGETPISSLTSGLPDGESAEAKLDEVKLEVLSKGWHYNTEDIKLKRNYQKEILIPVTYMRVDTTDSDRDTNVSVRVNLTKRKLYNLTTKVFTFDKDLQCRVTINFEFEDLTIELQNYIAFRAARKFQESSMGSVALDSFTQRAEMEAWAALQDAESELEDNNILTDNAHCYYATHRYHTLSGR